MNGIENYIGFIIAGIILNLTPGADTIYIITRSIAQGRKSGINSVLGIRTGALFHTAFAAFGLSLILMKSATIFTIIKYLGVVCLIYLGIKMIVDKSNMFENEKYKFESPDLIKIYRQGFLTNLLNPKFAIFFLSLKFNHMKYIITILIASLSIVSAFAQQDSIVEVPSINELQSRTAGDELELANQLYINSEFEKAITAYKAILQGGMESAELYFNMGNAYYKQGMLTDAILNYERAKLLAPTDKDIDFNLSLMNQFVVDKIEPLPRPFFISWWDAIVNLNTANNWGKISVALFILMLACAGFYTFSRSVGMKKIGFTLALILFVGSALTFGMAAQQKSKISHRNHAIILTPTVTVKASPDQSGTPLFVIHEGLKVEVIGELASWIEIQLADGNSGWIKRSDLEVI